MSSDNSMRTSSQFKRFRTHRVFIEDLKEGAWDENEKSLATRYGSLKKARLCGVIIFRKEFIPESSNESNPEYFADSNAPNSRLSFILDDGTGQIWMSLFGIDIDNYQELVQGKFVDVIGRISYYKGKPTVNISIIHIIADSNYDAYHMADILHKRKFEPKMEIEHVSQPTFTDFEFDDQETFEEKLEDQGFLSEEQESSSDLTISKPSIKEDINESKEIFDDMEIQDQIVEYIQNNDQGDGVAIGDIATKFKLEKSKVKNILEDLRQDLRIYKCKPGYYQSF